MFAAHVWLVMDMYSKCQRMEEMVFIRRYLSAGVFTETRWSLAALAKRCRTGLR